jgi:diguanylate cyclase
VKRLREALAQARQEASTDGLSNLANRRAFDDELKRACAGTGTVSLALLDIDHFKTINDSWGHQTGDQVIRFVASVISRIGASPRFAARFGGDEFAMIFVGEPADGVDRALNEVLVEIRSRPLRRRDTNEPLGDITLSGGFAQRRAGDTTADLMKRADRALYASKQAGRDRISQDGSATLAPVVTLTPKGGTPRPAVPAGSVSGARGRVLAAMRRG